MAVALSGIYLIRNLRNGKVYVGSAVDIKRRWRVHKKRLNSKIHNSLHLRNAWHLHGPENFTFEILEHVQDRTQLVPREQLWIWFYDSAKKEYGYNLSPTAGSTLGTKFSNEARANMSLARIGNKNGQGHRGRVFTAEHRMKLSVAQSGKKYSMASRKKMSAAHKGRPNGCEGKPRSEATRQKLALASKRWWQKKREQTLC